ncbi:MAG: hypothetical protein ACYTBW_06000 [Planctomycetota bacterium]|jgi:hypothetical protein
MSETNDKTEDLQCPLMDTCAFLCENRTTMPELVERIQGFKIAQSVGTEKVPPLMLPEQVEWAQQIIEECDRDLESGGRLAGVE